MKLKKKESQEASGLVAEMENVGGDEEKQVFFVERGNSLRPLRELGAET